MPEVVATTGTGPDGWSAGLALGLSTQVPHHETMAVPGRAPRNPGSVRFVGRAASVKRRDERLRPIEVALFEVLRDWDVLVEVSFDVAVSLITAAVSAPRRRTGTAGEPEVGEPNCSARST